MQVLSLVLALWILNKQLFFCRETVRRGTDDHPLDELSVDRDWISAGSPVGVVWRDFAPGGLLEHEVETEGMPLCSDFFRGGLRTNGSHKNVYMFRYHTEAGRSSSVSREGRKHWWVQNAGLKLVVGKINFRAKKIGGSRKVNWWVRNFCPHNHLAEFLLDHNLGEFSERILLTTTQNMGRVRLARTYASREGDMSWGHGPG
jgi:hypothetical protein